MSKGRGIQFWARKAVGFAAAYLIALQLVLAGAVATKMAMPGPDGLTILCSGAQLDPADHSGQSKSDAIHHAFCAVCAFAAHAAPLAAPTSLHVARATTAVEFSAVATATVRASRQHDPRTSQGPPLNA